MQDYILFVLGNIFSCFITTFIVFQYLNEIYEKRYNNQAVYILLQIAISTCMVFINLHYSVPANTVCWILGFCIIAVKFFDAYEKRRLRKITEITLLFLILAICESLGYVLAESLILKIQTISIPLSVQHCIKTIFSSLWTLLLYYLFVARIWKSDQKNKLTKSQYIVYCLIILYSMLNMLLIAILIPVMGTMNSREMTLLLVNVFVIVFTDLFFLFFTKFTEENSRLKMKLRLLEQQAQVQYDYYASQEEKYNESIAILHDTDKHLRMIEGIYEAEQAQEARQYTGEIRKLLKPLLPLQYTNNPILNILLNDKKRRAISCNIDFKLEIGNIDLSFMEPMEITTLFGNLLDNAIEACQQVAKNPYISMRINTYNDFIVIKITNSCKRNEKWNTGKPLSTKGENHGIGLINAENIVKKYNGNILLEEKDHMFICNIILNE